MPPESSTFSLRNPDEAFVFKKYSVTFYRSFRHAQTGVTFPQAILTIAIPCASSVKPTNHLHPSDSTECVITLTKASTIPTPLGGSSLTVSSSPCEFDPAASFELHTVEGYL